MSDMTARRCCDARRAQALLAGLAGSTLIAATPAWAQADDDGAAHPVFDNASVVETAGAGAGRERMVILGSRAAVRELAGSGEFLSVEDLRVHAYEDVNRVLRVVPGVYIQEEDGFGLRPNIGLRGSGLDRSSRITLMEDGVLAAPAPYSAPSAYYFPTVGRMSGVEVIKGAGGVRFGPQTIGGAINLISTPTPSETHVFANLRAGEHDTLRAHVYGGGPLYENDAVRIAGLVETFQDTSGGFRELDNGGDTGYRIEDYTARLELETRGAGGARHFFSVNAQYSDERSNETYLGLTDADYAATPYRRYAASQLDQMNAEHSQFGARWRAEFSNGLDLSVAAYRTNFARDWFKTERVNPAGTAINSGSSGVSTSSVLAAPGANAASLAILRGDAGLVSADGAVLIRHNNREYYAQGLQAVLGYEGAFLGAQHDIEFGVRVHYDEEDRFQNFERFRMDNGTLVRTGVDAPGSQANRVSSAEAIAVYVQDSIEWDRWTFIPGARFESITLTREDYSTADPTRALGPTRTRENDVSAFIPGLGVVYDLSDRISLFGGVHRGFSPPAPGSTSDVEDATNWELGARAFFDNAQLEAVAFYNDYSNIVGTCTASTGGRCVIGDQFDGGEAEIWGLELSGQSDLGRMLDAPVGVPVSFAYTYTSAEFSNDFTSGFGPWGTVTAGDEIPYIPEHQLTASIGLTGERWDAELLANYVGEVRTVAGQGDIALNERIDARVIFDVSAGYDLTENVRISIQARNVFDEEYAVARRPAGIRAGMPRTVLIGLTLDY